MLHARGLRKRYKSREVVRDFGLDLNPGEVVGLLGPNGAGKTTCFYMIVGLIPADAGEIFFNDHNITGMPMHERARLGIGYLPQEPKFILLDEPFAGVDPISVAEIQKIVIHLKHRGIGVLITDHNVRETLGICDRAYILNAGSVLTQGTPEEILENPDVRRVYLGDKFKL